MNDIFKRLDYIHEKIIPIPFLVGLLVFVVFLGWLMLTADERHAQNLAEKKQYDTQKMACYQKQKKVCVKTCKGLNRKYHSIKTRTYNKYDRSMQTKCMCYGSETIKMVHSWEVRF